MATKEYDWESGAKLEDHTRRKLKILREYFRQYIHVRCQHAQQTRFRLAIVDGFSGGGRYECGTSGSPLIFVEELCEAVDQINIERRVDGRAEIAIECFLQYNDIKSSVIHLLKENMAPLLANATENYPSVIFKVEYLNEAFEVAYPTIAKRLEDGRFKNIIYNLDQCGDTHVDFQTLRKIISSKNSVEVFYTYMVSSLVAYLKKDDIESVKRRLSYLHIDATDFKYDENLLSKHEWMGATEKLIFDHFRSCATYLSPFSIPNPEGWMYWYLHFSNSYRARQVYNDVLHSNSSQQAHFGRSGLRMLSYDPKIEEGNLYFFKDSDRDRARSQLMEDIPRLISESGDIMEIQAFYEDIYSETPSHSMDIHQAIIENPDVEVITPTGGERRKAHTITIGDTIKLKKQRSFKWE